MKILLHNPGLKKIEMLWWNARDAVFRTCFSNDLTV